MNFREFFFGKPIEEPKFTHADRVHLIVHPGDGTTLRDAAADKLLLDSMAQRAISLNAQHELAVVLLQMDEKSLQKLREPSYTGGQKNLAEGIRRMEQVLPKNLIVVPNAASVHNERLDSIFDDVEARMQALGFKIDAETRLLAYGEMVTQCVPIGASRFARHFKLHRSPVIDVNCTDALINDPSMWTRNGLRLGLSNSLSEGRLRFIPIGQTEREGA